MPFISDFSYRFVVNTSVWRRLINVKPVVSVRLSVEAPVVMCVCLLYCQFSEGT